MSWFTQVGAGGASKKRGIYLRGATETHGATTHLVSVQPSFHEDAPPELRTGLELRLRLHVAIFTGGSGAGAVSYLLVLPTVVVGS